MSKGAPGAQLDENGWYFIHARDVVKADAVEDMGTAKFYVCPRAAMKRAAKLVPVHALYRDQPTLAAQLYTEPTVAALQITRTLHDVEQAILIADRKKADAEMRRRTGKR